MSDFSPQQAKHVAGLAQIPLSEGEAEKFAEDFSQTLQVIGNLNSQDIKNIEPTHQVTGLVNVLRADKINEQTTFTQKQALANAAQTGRGYFVVSRVLKNKD